MIRMATGSIFDSEAEALVNPVNIVGVMGKGLALEFKRRYPATFAQYHKECLAGRLRIGQVLACEEGGKIVVCLPTKRHYAEKSRLAYVESGLLALSAELSARGTASVAIPALGCGLGGLDWGDVRPLIERIMSRNRTVETYLYPPG